MAKTGRGSGAPGKGVTHGDHGGNRAGTHERPPTRGPRNDQQAQGKDPHRGEPAGGPTG